MLIDEEPLPRGQLRPGDRAGDYVIDAFLAKGGCGAVYLGVRAVCSKCGAREKIAPVKLSNEGHLYVYSIVCRSFPGIQVPYVSAIVDLEGGGTVKGNLTGVDPDPAKIKMGMPVRVVYKDALGRKDKEGNSYLSYFFEPR